VELREFVEKLRSLGIEWLDLQFTDLAGTLRHVTVHTSIVDEESVERGFGKLDGNSVKGFEPIETSDLVLKPIPETLAVLPWYPKTARVLCTVFARDGSRYPKDPRYVAEKLEQYLAELGYRALVGLEIEFFVFDSVKVVVEPWRQILEIRSSESNYFSSVFNRPRDGYYAVPPYDKLFDLRLEVGDTLRKYFGIEATVLHHEVGAYGQCEIGVEAGTPTVAGDRFQTIKFVVKNVAARRGMVATFMPKPMHGDNGSGWHIHLSLWSLNGSRNLFYDPSDEYAELSDLARHFVAGLIEHGRALSAIVSPTTNSYRRLVPGYEAPVYLVWSRANRSAAIRVPSYVKGDEKGKRIEYRPPDPSANPYLAIAAVIMAGLDGIRKKLEPPDPIDRNVYTMSEEERRKLGIETLPRSLEEALDELESDHEWLKPVFTEELIQQYIDMKREEARKLNLYVPPAEILHYLDV